MDRNRSTRNWRACPGAPAPDARATGDMRAHMNDTQAACAASAHPRIRAAHARPWTVRIPWMAGLCLCLALLLCAGYAAGQECPNNLLEDKNYDFEKGHEDWSEIPSNGIIENDSANARDSEWYSRFRSAYSETIEESISQRFDKPLDLSNICQEVDVPGLDGDIYIQQDFDTPDTLPDPGLQSVRQADLRIPRQDISDGVFLRQTVTLPSVIPIGPQRVTYTGPITGDTLTFTLRIESPNPSDWLTVHVIDIANNDMDVITISANTPGYVSFSQAPEITVTGAHNIAFEAETGGGSIFYITNVRIDGDPLPLDIAALWSGDPALIVPIGAPYDRAIRLGAAPFELAFFLKITEPFPGATLAVQLVPRSGISIPDAYVVTGAGAVLSAPFLAPDSPAITIPDYTLVRLLLPAIDFQAGPLEVRFQYRLLDPNNPPPETFAFHVDDVSMSELPGLGFLNPGFEGGPSNWDSSEPEIRAQIIVESAEARFPSAWSARFSSNIVGAAMDTELQFQLKIAGPSGSGNDYLSVQIYGQEVLRVREDGSYASLPLGVTLIGGWPTAFDNFALVHLRLSSTLVPTGAKFTTLLYEAKIASGTTFYVDDACYMVNGGDCAVDNKVENPGFDANSPSPWTESPTDVVIIGEHGSGNVYSTDKSARFCLPPFELAFFLKIMNDIGSEYLRVDLINILNNETFMAFRVSGSGSIDSDSLYLPPGASLSFPTDTYEQVVLHLPALEYKEKSLWVKFTYEFDKNSEQHAVFFVDDVTMNYLGTAVDGLENGGFEAGHVYPIYWESKTEEFLFWIITDQEPLHTHDGAWVARLTGGPVETELRFFLMIENPGGAGTDYLSVRIFEREVLRIYEDGHADPLEDGITAEPPLPLLYNTFQEVRLRLPASIVTASAISDKTRLCFTANSPDGTVYYIDNVCFAAVGNCVGYNKVINGDFESGVSPWAVPPGSGDLIIGEHEGKAIDTKSARLSGSGDLKLRFKLKILRENPDDYVRAVVLSNDEHILIEISGEGVITCYPDASCSPSVISFDDYQEVTVVFPGTLVMSESPEIIFEASITRGDDGAIFHLDDVVLEDVVGLPPTEYLANGDFEEDPLGDPWHEVPEGVIIDATDPEYVSNPLIGRGADDSPRFTRFADMDLQAEVALFQSVLTPPGRLNLSFWLKMPTAGLPGESLSVYFDGVLVWALTEEFFGNYVGTEYVRVPDPEPLITIPINQSGGLSELRFVSSVMPRENGTEFHVDDVCLQGGGLVYMDGISGVRVSPVIRNPITGRNVGVGRTFVVEVDYLGAVDDTVGIVIRPQLLGNWAELPAVMSRPAVAVATSVDGGTLRVTEPFQIPGTFAPSPLGSAVCLDGLASVHIDLGGGYIYGVRGLGGNTIFTNSTAIEESQFVIDTTPPALDSGFADSIFPANSRAADYILSVNTSDVYSAPLGRAPYVAGWPGVALWPSSAGVMTGLGVGPQVFFNTSMNPDVPDPLSFGIVIPFVDVPPVDSAGNVYSTVERAGFWSKTLAPVTAAGVWHYPDSAGYYPEESTEDEVLGQYAGLPYPPGTGLWGREPGGNAPDFGPIVGAEFPSYDNGMRAQAQWTLADVPWLGGRSWHLPTFFEMSDLAGNTVVTKDFSFWWQYDPVAVFTSGPEGTLTNDPVFSWALLRTAQETPSNAAPCEPIAQFRLWRADNPDFPAATAWTALTGWSPWIRTATIDRYAPVSLGTSNVTTVDDILRNSALSGDLLMITVAGADEAGNVQAIDVASGDTLSNRAALGGIDSRTWYVPDSVLRLDTAVQARFWYNSRVTGDILRLDPGERNFGSSTRIPIVPPERCDVRIEAEFTFTMEHAGELAGLIGPGVVWEFYEDNRLVAEGYSQSASAGSVVRLRIPNDILVASAQPGQTRAIPPNDPQDYVIMYTPGIAFLNRSPGRCECVQDRLGDDGGVYGVDNDGCPGDNDGRFRRRDVTYLLSARTAYFDTSGAAFTMVYADPTPASVQFTVFVPGELRDEQPIKVYTRE